MPPKKTDKAEPRKALVKWMGGNDDGLLSVIEQDWIKNFSEKKWNKTPVPLRETEVAEWRVGKKPDTGYLCYDCEVLACSGKAETLEDMKKDIIAKEKKAALKGKGEAADRKTEEEAREDADSETELGADKEAGEGTAAKKTDKDGKMDLNDSSSEHSDDSSCTKENSRQVKLTAASTTTLQKLQKKTSILTAGKGNKAKESPEVSLMPPKRKKSSPKSPSVEEDSATASASSQPDKVPLYKGCPYHVDSVVYNHHKHLGASSFTTAILQQLFEPRILVVSNITGALSKIDPNGMRRWALDKKKMLALKTAVMAHYPKVTDAAVNKIIMNHINSLRNRLKTKGKLQKLETKGRAALEFRGYTQDSSSGSESSSEHE